LTAGDFHLTIAPEVLLAARAVAVRALSYVQGTMFTEGHSMPMKKKAKKKKKH
jgi:hypothetical protein